MTELDLDSSGARAILAINDAQSIRAAARDLGISPNTLRYRLKRIEQQAGTCLFRRTKDGAEPTADGAKAIKLARAMRAAATSENFDPTKDVVVTPGQVTIACGEGIGSIWLTPMIGSLQARLGKLAVGLNCDYDHSRAHANRADVGIAFVQPSDPDVIVSRLGTLHFRCYGTDAYFRNHPIPTRPEELRDHSLIEQSAPGLNPELRNFIIGQVGDEPFIRFRTTSSLAMYYAVVSGSGLAFMPTYISHFSKQLRMVDLSIALRFDMLYFYHADAKDSPTVRTTIDWLKSAFDPRVYPCFADEFVHPDEFDTTLPGRNVVPLFPSFPD